MQTTPLGSLVKISKGRKVGSVINIKTHGSKRYIQIGDLRNDDNLKFTNDDGVEVEKNDVIIAWDGANAGTVGFDLEGIIGSTLAKLKIIDERFTTNYLGRLLQAKSKYLRQYCTGATIPHISRNILENIDIPLISIEEQKSIVSKLELISNAENKRKQAIELLDKYVRSVFLEIFGDPVINSKEWEIKPIGELIDFMTSGSRGWAKYYATDGSIFLTIKNVNRNGKLFLDEITYVNAPNNAESKRTQVREGDVLLSITADLGRSAVVEGLPREAFINQHLAILHVKDIIQSHYLSFYLCSEGGQLQMQKMNKGASKAGLNFNDIRSIKIPLPPLDLQIKFREVIHKIDTLKQKMQIQAEEIDKLFQISKPSYFS